MTGAKIIEDAAESLRIAAKLERAAVFAMCDDGSVYKLEDFRIRPPMTARVANRQSVNSMMDALKVPGEPSSGGTR